MKKKRKVSEMKEHYESKRIKKTGENGGRWGECESDKTEKLNFGSRRSQTEQAPELLSLSKVLKAVLHY